MKVVWALLIVFLIIGGAFMSDKIFDHVKVSVLSRKAIHLTAGAGMLILPFIFESFWWPLGISIFFLIALSILHFTNAKFGYGVRTPGRFVEIWFCLSCVVVYATVWRIDPWLATAPLVWMAIGDGVTGLLRWPLYHKQGEKGIAGTAGMLAVCLTIAIMVHPYWIGAVGAVAATLAEKYTPSRGYWLDDNWAIPLAASLVMVPLYLAFG